MAEKKKIIKPRAAKDMKPDSLRQKALDSAKKTPKTPRSTGTMTSGERIGDVKKTRVSRFKPPALRSTTEPTKFKKPSTSVTEYRKPSTSVTEYRKPSTGVTKYEPPKGGSSGGSGKGSMMSILGLPAAAAGFYLGDTFSSKTGNQANYGEREEIQKGLGPLMKGNTSVKAGDKPRPMTFGDKGNAGRVSAYKAPKAAKSTPDSGASKAEKFKALQQGQKASAGPNVKKAGDKSRVAGGKTSRPDGKLSSFEQMKKRQYERDFTARPMTSSQAKSKVVKERGYKFKDLFK